MRRIILFITLFFAVANVSAAIDELRNKLEQLAGDNNVGIAVISCYGDTVTVRGREIFDMASVAKFHQAVALSKTLSFEQMADTKIVIDPRTLERNTWSPMRAAAGTDTIILSPAHLLDYSLMMSDNNAADILFDRFNSPPTVDSILRHLGYPGEYSIRFSEKQMHTDSLGACNTSSPLAAAAAINRFFASDTTASATLIKAIMSRDTPFGKERIMAGLEGKGAKVFHKTGTGFNGANGTPVAINDLAFVSYHTSWGYGCYSIAVFLKDFKGSKADGEKLIADISSAVWDAIMVKEVKLMNASANIYAGKKSGSTPAETQSTTNFLGSFLGAIGGALLENALDRALGLEE